MHYRLEIIMPPTEDIVQAVETILKPFDENNEDEEGKMERFWDWWEIGGRYAGMKFKESFDEKKLDMFCEWLVEEKITVSGIVFGKETLNPSSQIEKVDKKWNEMFPSDKFVPCPLFDHSNTENTPGDIIRLDKISERTTAYRAIIASPSFVYDDVLKKGEYTGKLEAKAMISKGIWNGVSFVETNWDGRVKSFLDKFIEKYPNATDEYKNAHIPKGDWLVVTVDYHCQLCTPSPLQSLKSLLSQIRP